MANSPVLYRAFTDRCYAEDFVSGKVRIGNLQHYHHIEDSQRQDTTEGIANYKCDAIDRTAQNGNPVYILSCSHESVDLSFLRKKMGAYIVRIDDIEQLKADIEYALKTMQFNILGKLVSNSVSYGKGGKRAREGTFSENHKLALFQKSPCYQNECEYRIAAIFDFTCPKQLLASHISIDLNNRLNYAKLLPC